jgi:DNA processing protein
MELLMDDRFEIQKDDSLFPSHLRQFSWCPQILYGRGDPARLTRGVGIIGARKATPYGVKAAKQIASWCAEFNLPVYSGAAAGCDQAAHRGALDAQGSTIAVLGCGADVVYPSKATALFDEIAATGCVLSHYEWGMTPKRYTFIERNRLIVALSRLLIVVEGRMPSGTFSAVNWADQLNVDIAAVPGSIFSAESKGPHHLLSNGAMPLCTKQDLAVALALTIEYEDEADPVEDIRRSALTQDEKEILGILAPMPLSIDEIVRAIDSTTVAVLVVANMLELKGFIQRLPDGRLIAVG